MSTRAQKWVSLVAVIIATILWLYRFPLTMAGMRDPLNTWVEWIAAPIIIAAWFGVRKKWKQANGN